VSAAIVGLVAWTLTRVAAAHAEAVPRCERAWEGTIVEAGTAEPLPGAHVVYRDGGGVPLAIDTDEHGRIELRDLCSTSLRVSVAMDDHATVARRIELDGAVTRSRIELPALHEHHSARVVVVHDEGHGKAEASESISGEALRRVRGRPLADAVSGIGGVAVLRSPAGQMGKPIIRGQVGRRNLILVDGVRHESQQWGLDHAPEVDADAAGRITVIKGAATTRYGQRASGGVLLLESRPLLRTPGVAGEAGTFANTNALGGGGSARVDWAPLRARGLAMRVDGNLGRHRSALAPDYTLSNTASSTWNAGARVGYLRDAFDVDVGYRVFRSMLGICDCLTISTREDFLSRVGSRRPPALSAGRPRFAIRRPQQRVTHHLALLRARVAVARGGELHALYAYQFDDREEFERVRANITGPQLELRLATHTAELPFEHRTVSLGSWSLEGIAGTVVGQQRNRIESANTLVPDYRQSSWGAYAVERLVHPRAELEGGVRYDGMYRIADLRERDYLGQLASGRIDEAACRERDDGGVCRHDFHAASGTIAGLVRPVAALPELAWGVKLDSAARMPAIDEQFMNGAAPTFPIIGQGDGRLGLERTWAGETTVRYDGAWLAVEGSAFASYIRDYIAFAPEPQEGECAPLTCTVRGPFPLFEFQATDARLYGGELHVDLQAPRLPLSLSGTGAWVRGDDLRRRRFLPLVPADRYTIVGRWTWPDTRATTHGYLELNGTLVARQRRFDVAQDFAPAPDRYVLLGAAVGVEIPGDEHVVHASLVGNNLLDTRYRDYTSLLRYFADEPGWSLQLRVSVEFAIADRRRVAGR
jgi:iron complex outermembrane receptor protein